MKATPIYLDTAESAELEGIEEALLKINRSAAVVKGGRRFSFSAVSSKSAGSRAICKPEITARASCFSGRDM